MKHLIFTMSLLALVSCKDSKKEEHVTEHNTQEQVSTEAVSHKEHETHQENAVLNNNWMNEIQLDNGAKWLADKQTTEGVNTMLKLISESKTETVEDYLSLANKLNDRKNTLVKECTMTGPSHDNLHVFLHPLIEKIEVLLETKTTEEGSETLKSMTYNLNVYKTYFK